MAGWVLGINAFDRQPNVQEAKDNTAKVLEAAESPAVEDADDAALAALLGRAAPRTTWPSWATSLTRRPSTRRWASCGR